MSICIKCGNELKTFNYYGIEFSICPKCNTVVISNENLNLIAGKFDKSINEVDLFALNAVETKEPKRKCSRCNNDMDKILYNGVLIDRCHNCRMLLFDNGELSKYFANNSKLPLEIMSNAMFIKTYCSNANYSKEDTADQTKSQKTLQNNVETIDNSTNKNNKKNTYNSERTYQMQIQSREKEKIFYPIDGFIMVGLIIFLAILTIFLCMYMTIFTFIPASLLIVLLMFLLNGFIIVKPQEAYVLTFFGVYVGTIKKAGFYWRNPFVKPVSFFDGNSISLKARTLNNEKQKINDEDGNPIEVGIMVTWEVQDSAMAVFNVDNYVSFLSAQCDSVLRKIIRQYPYDTAEDSEKETLKGDSAEISEKLKIEIQNAVIPAGLHIIDARITHLAYSSEIAIAMLQKQQANAVIAARTAIVNGAVSMVEMAIDKLSQNDNLTLSDADKAKMVNNLLVVLCGNKDTQPVIQM